MQIIKLILRIISFIINILFTAPLFVISVLLDTVVTVLIYFSYAGYRSFDIPEELFSFLPKEISKTMRKNRFAYNLLKIFLLLFPPFKKAFKQIHFYLKNTKF